MLDSRKSEATIAATAPVAQRTEQRFPKTKSLVTGGRHSQKQALPESNSLETGTASLGLCAPVDLDDEYTGKRLRPLWELAQSTGNAVLRRLVLRYEAEVEGILMAGRRSA
jgi:hypothetical protein